MSQHVFHPPTELATQVVAYAHGLKTHHASYGDVPGSSPAELKPLEHQATALAPIAEEITQLELELAAKKERYARAAGPLWTAFSEKITIARTHAEKQQKDALLGFVHSFRHHVVHHDAAKQAGAVHAGDASGTPTAK